MKKQKLKINEENLKEKVEDLKEEVNKLNTKMKRQKWINLFLLLGK